MKSRFFAIAAIAVVLFVLGAQHRQTSLLRDEVERLRSEIARNQRARDSQSLIVPIQGSSHSGPPTRLLPQKRSPFRLLDGGNPDDSATERGMKADEFELKHRQQKWYERQQDPHAPEPIQGIAPPWAENAVPQLD